MRGATVTQGYPLTTPMADMIAGPVVVSLLLFFAVLANFVIRGKFRNVLLMPRSNTGWSLSVREL